MALPLSAVHAPRHSGTAALGSTCTSLREHYSTRAFGTKEGDFSSRIYLPSATYLNLVNAEFFSAGHFSSCCQGGEALYLAVAQILILLIVWAQHRLCCRFHCCWCRLYTTARLNAARIFAVGVGVMLPISLMLVPPLHYREVKCCPNFRRWCRRYAADFTAVGAAFTLPRG